VASSYVFAGVGGYHASSKVVSPACFDAPMTALTGNTH